MSGERPPTTVILPTVEWASACEQVADQLGPDDELLVVCDRPDDPVALRPTPDGVTVVVAGEPERCSGKANAVAAGMERARSDRIVWTDDDFRHPPDWLDGLHAAYERHGPASEVPVFVGRDPLSVLLEPTYVLPIAVGTVTDGLPWGGGVVFERDDLDADALVAELRRSVSDDGVLSEHLDVTTLARGRRVPVGGTLRATLERHVRFVQITRRHGSRGFLVGSALGVGAAAAAVLYPLAVGLALTLVAAVAFARVGELRPTALLAWPAALVQVPLLAYALARRTFVWGGRRYRWPERHDVRVESRSERRH